MKRFKEVTSKLNSLYNSKDGNEKDAFVSALKVWVRNNRSNRNEDMFDKYDAIICFLADNDVII